METRRSDGPVKILLVEDNPGDVRLIREMLAEAELTVFEVEWAEDLSTGLKYLKSDNVDAVLLDLGLPESSGLETLAKVQAIRAGVPIVVLTGLEDETLGAEAVRAGAQDYLVKGQVDANPLARTLVYGIERKRLEEDLQASEKRYRDLFEQSIDAIYTTSTGGRFLEVNQAYLDLFGYAREEIDAVSAEDFYSNPEDRSEFQRVLRENGYVKDFPITSLKKDGTTIHTLDSTVTQYGPDGEVVGYQGIIRDVTEHKESEDKLRASESRLSETQRIAKLGSWVWNITEDTLWWSDETYAVFGRTPQEFSPTHEASLAAVHPDDTEHVGEALDAALHQGESFDIYYRILHPDGSERVVQSRGSVTRDEAGDPVRMVGHVQDMTEQRLLEEQLRQSQKIEAVGQLAGGVAHDFNNLLTGIIGYTQLVQRKIGAESPQAADLGRVLQLSNRAASLTRQLLAFSRRQTLESKVFNLNALLQDSNKVLTRLIGEHIEVEFHPGPDAGNVRGDPSQIEQVVFNLMINARDAMPEGGKLTLETADVMLDEEYCDRHVAVAPGRYVMLAVTDAGCGMDAETLEQIFEPFFTTKERGEGTGLGLAVVYGIVKQHGGSIWVYSEPGRGTTVKVYLARVEEEAEEISYDEEPVAALTGSETILVVEDEETVRVITKRALEEQGYRVYTAATPGEAEALYSKHEEEIDLLLTDVVLPEMDGPSLFARMSEQTGSLKVLYMSGYAEAAILRNKLVAGEVNFIQKPFAQIELARKVREALGKE